MEKDDGFISLVIEAITQPSLDHIMIYLCICLIFAVVIAAIKLSQLEINDTKEDDPSKAVDKYALYMDLDREGPFPKSETGQIAPESFVKLKRAIGKAVHSSYKLEYL